ncbi:RagB/SusD family nutrient uptake outer membrane protein [Parabacteroides sp. APC149_11_2_Y6]
MKKHNLFCLLGTFLLVAFTSCEMLDSKPLDKIESYDVFKDSTRVDAYVLGLYKYLPQGYNRFDNQAMLSSATDESTQCISNNGMTPFINGSWGPTSNPDAGWTNYYEGIMMVNLLFENIGMLYPSTSEDFKNSVLAEAHFLRAYYHFELVKRFGGVPIITRTLTVNDSPDIPRDSYADCVDFIVNECDSAILYLPTVEVAARVGRATGVAAMALKSRMLLYAASPLFNGPDVTGSNNPLVGYGTENPERWKVAAKAAHDLLEFYPGTISLFNTGANAMLKYQNLFTTPALAQNKENLMVKTRQQDNEIEKNNAPIGYTNARGGVCPSQNLVDAYEMKNGKSIHEEGSGYNAKNPYANRDPRFAASIQYNEATWWNRKVETFIGGLDASDADINATKTGYYLRKFSNPTAIIFGNTKNGIHYFPLFRTGEALLNYAEAMNEAYGPTANPFGDGRTAKWAVDEVRKRAGMPVVPAKGLTYEVMKQKIVNERRIELAFEEHRHWDIRRWKIAEQVFKEPIKGVRIEKEGTSFKYTYYDVEQRIFSPKMYLYPIPQGECYKNKALVQNPLWGN